MVHFVGTFPPIQADLVAERLGQRGSNPQIPGSIPGSVRSLLPLTMAPKAGPVTGTFACAVIPCVWEVIESLAGGTTLFHTSVQIGGIRSILA